MYHAPPGSFAKFLSEFGEIKFGSQILFNPNVGFVTVSINLFNKFKTDHLVDSAADSLQMSFHSPSKSIINQTKSSQLYELQNNKLKQTTQN